MEFLNKLDDLIIEFVQGSPAQLQEMYYTGPAKLIFLVPVWMLKCIEVEGQRFSIETEIIVRGVRLLPNHEDSLVLYHPEYGIYKDKRYIRKVTLLEGYIPTEVPNVKLIDHRSEPRKYPKLKYDRKLNDLINSLLKLALPENPLDSSFLP